MADFATNPRLGRGSILVIGTGEETRLQRMKAYRLLVHDDRSPAPLEWKAVMAHDARVAEFCRDRIAASRHVAAIEIWAGPVKLCHLRGEARQAA
ncbi:MAG TPA: hypothetical protein VGI95_10655 [Caulobacteraceae bacterium]